MSAAMAWKKQPFPGQAGLESFQCSHWLEKGERHWWSKQNSVHVSGFTFCMTTGFHSNIAVTANMMKDSGKYFKMMAKMLASVLHGVKVIGSNPRCVVALHRKLLWWFQWSAPMVNFKKDNDPQQHLQASSNYPISLFKINCQHKP